MTLTYQDRSSPGSPSHGSGDPVVRDPLMGWTPLPVCGHAEPLWDALSPAMRAVIREAAEPPACSEVTGSQRTLLALRRRGLTTMHQTDDCRTGRPRYWAGLTVDGIALRDWLMSSDGREYTRGQR
jgi:hypothetical protein